MVITAFKGLPTSRLVMLWLWLMVMAVTPIGWIVVLILAWKSR
jgi:hypothetical protein